MTNDSVPSTHLFDELLYGIICVEDVLLDELQGPGAVGELAGQAVRQLGPLQLPLLRAQRRIYVRPEVLHKQIIMSHTYN